MPLNVNPDDLKWYLLVISAAANLVFTVKSLKQSVNGIGGKVNAQFLDHVNMALAAVANEENPEKRRWLAGFYKRGLK